MTITLGTRGSRLALWQANAVKKAILGRFPDLLVKIKVIKTEGDRLLDRSLSSYGGKGLFVKALEEKLLKGEIDIAVHSMKDVPAVLFPRLTIGAVLKREEPFDVIVCRDGYFRDLKKGAVIGTSSLRRIVQLKVLRKDLHFEPLRGNVDTRIKKLFKGEYEAIVLAKAALRRLGVDINMEILPIVPACGQGVIGMEVRDASKLKDIVCSVNDEETFKCVWMEREFVRLMGAGCNDPIGAYAEKKGDKVVLSVMYAIRKNGEWKMFNFAEEGSCIDELPKRCVEKMNRLVKDE